MSEKQNKQLGLIYSDSCEKDIREVLKHHKMEMMPIVNIMGNQISSGINLNKIKTNIIKPA